MDGVDAVVYCCVCVDPQFLRALARTLGGESFEHCSVVLSTSVLVVCTSWQSRGLALRGKKREKVKERQKERKKKEFGFNFITCQLSQLTCPGGSVPFYCM